MTMTLLLMFVSRYVSWDQTLQVLLMILLTQTTGARTVRKTLYARSPAPVFVNMQMITAVELLML